MVTKFWSCDDPFLFCCSSTQFVITSQSLNLTQCVLFLNSATAASTSDVAPTSIFGRCWVSVKSRYSAEGSGFKPPMCRFVSGKQSCCTCRYFWNLIMLLGFIICKIFSVARWEMKQRLIFKQKHWFSPRLVWLCDFVFLCLCFLIIVTGKKKKNLLQQGIHFRFNTAEHSPAQPLKVHWRVVVFQ